ncbi:DNA mismatch repair endonuclease MutL [candidate division WOR-3 bacterium]|nr:DNA mismatch repair endonuclease MutL [candidate division WOR-3 bacterium]
MESKIIILSEDLVSKIAAGEVVERPASCIKELIENSIDAGAKRIFCEVRGSGVPELKVSDDGIGMTLSELELAIKPHTTSKLKSEADLWEIKNLGFRGEALPSMCHVAEVEISSRIKEREVGMGKGEVGSGNGEVGSGNGEVGSYIRVQGEEVIEKREIARDFGTTVSVRNLFYNMPARRKFLKSETTELRYIVTIIQRLSLAYPDISFILSHKSSTGKHEILNLRAQDLTQRIIQLFGKDFLNTLGFVDYTTPSGQAGIKIYGYASKPYTLSSRFHQFIFVNKRPCRDRIIKKAIENAYGVPLKDRVPSFIIFLDLPPKFIDVNVHPRKEEVRFRDESLIYTTVLKSIREALGIKVPYFQPQVSREDIFELQGSKFWQLHDSYIFAQTRGGVLILDQHAAHERVMYERIMKEPLVSQKLLFPMVIQLTVLEEKFLNEFKDTLEKLGFEVKEFGQQTVRVISIPSVLKNFTPDLFKSMLLELEEYGNTKEDRFSAVAKLLACKSAVKSGESLTQEEMNVLIDELFATQNPYFCPHGRPAIIRMTKEELEHRFGK